MVEQDLAERCRKQVEEYCGANQTTQTHNSVVSSHQHNRINETRASHTFRNVLISILFVASASVGYYALNYNKNSSVSLTQISSETPVQQSNQAMYRPSQEVQRPEVSAQQSNQTHPNPQKKDTIIQIVTTNQVPPIDYGKLRQERLNYFNSQYQQVIELTRQRRYEEADKLSLKLMEEIKKEKQGYDSSNSTISSHEVPHSETIAKPISGNGAAYRLDGGLGKKVDTDGFYSNNAQSRVEKWEKTLQSIRSPSERNRVLKIIEDEAYGRYSGDPARTVYIEGYRSLERSYGRAY